MSSFLVWYAELKLFKRTWIQNEPLDKIIYFQIGLLYSKIINHNTRVSSLQPIVFESLFEGLTAYQ